MALNTRGGGSSNKTYLSIYQGNMVLEYSVKEELEKKLESLGLDPENIRERKRTKGKHEGKDVFYYVLYDVSGYMTGVYINETDWGDFVEVEFTDLDEKYSVSLGDVFSRMSKDFIRRVGNIDLNEEIVFGVWNISAEEADNGKSKSGVRMYQNDNKLEYYVSYEDMPEPEQKKKGRKTEWDYSEQENYLYKVLLDWKNENFVDNDVDESLPEKQEAPSRKAPRGENSEKKNDKVPF